MALKGRGPAGSRRALCQRDQRTHSLSRRNDPQSDAVVTGDKEIKASVQGVLLLGGCQ